MILCTEKHKESTKLLELINDFSEVTEYKINIEKSVVFLYTSNEEPKNEIKNTIPFTTSSHRIKYLRINLVPKVQDLHTENYKKTF